VINNIKGRLEIAGFKWNKSKLKWPMLGLVLVGLYLAWNGDYGYIPAEYCSIYPWVTYGIVIVPLLTLLVELELINRKYKSTLDEIRSKYGLKS
jgi:hypothetical protein